VLSARSHTADDVLRGQLRSDDAIEIVDAKGSVLQWFASTKRSGFVLKALSPSDPSKPSPKPAARARPAHSSRPDAAFGAAARSDAGFTRKGTVIETPLMIAGGLAAIAIAVAEIVDKLRLNSREFNRAFWGQWRRG